MISVNTHAQALMHWANKMLESDFKVSMTNVLEAKRFKMWECYYLLLLKCAEFAQ